MAGVLLNKPRIMGLDGIRALAVIAVILYHLLPTWVPGGYVGVDIFFVISGFLITTLLLREHEKRGQISLKAFWQRRVRRLLPALVVTIGVVSSIALFIKGDILVGLGRQILGALTFSGNWVEIASGTNYFDGTAPHLFTNFWSLAVEEQFYLVWPFMMMGILGIPLLYRYKWLGAGLTVSLAIASAVWMGVAYDGHNATRVYYGSDTHVFGLMIGAALAFWEFARTAGIPSRRLIDQTPFRMELFGRVVPLQLLGLLSFIGLIALMIFMKEHQAFAYEGGLFLATVLGAVLIMATVTKRGFLQRLFTLRILEWIGVRSYGLYLWHWPILVLLQVSYPALESWATVAIGLGLTVIAAALSYRYVETPIRQRGLRATIKQAIRRQPIIISNAETRWQLRLHPMLFGSLLVVALTTTAVITAPQQTQAEAQIKRGEMAIQTAGERPVLTRPVTTPTTDSLSAHEPSPPPPAPAPITGTDITLIGDSVTLASAPALVEKYPGILIDAKISRTLRNGGFQDIDALEATGNLRRIVIISLGTNGYFGDGSLDMLMAKMAERQVIFVTSHGPNVWDVGNNQNLRATAPHYPNMYIADWDHAISARPDALGPDGIHPNATGGLVYTDCIAGVLATLR